jgi:hypothetical protein
MILPFFIRIPNMMSYGLVINVPHGMSILSHNCLVLGKIMQLLTYDLFIRKYYVYNILE